MFYDEVYLYLLNIVNIKIFGILACRLLAPIILLVVLWISRIISSFLIKIFAIAIAMIVYFSPDVVSIFIK